MSENSKIEWTDATFNPWWGCTKVSPACDHCYAETFARRVGFSDLPGAKHFPIWGHLERRRFFGDKHWAEPLKWNRKAAEAGERKRVFCGSMCDVMEDRIDLVPSRRPLYDLIERTLNLDWLLPTKRPQNFRRFLPQAWLQAPRPNVWGMTTVENMDYLWRVKALLDTRLAVRGLSCEPLLGPLDLATVRVSGRGEEYDPYVEANVLKRASVFAPHIHWVIVGGESGHGARPMDLDWARRLRDQCQTAGAAFFMKQICDRRGRPIPFEEFPADLQVREYPKEPR